MSRNRFHLVLVLLAALTAGVQAQSPSVNAGREADRAAIRAHIEAITQAFIEGDVLKIHDTHSEDWHGFLEGSRQPIRGIDEYMKANGLKWPLEGPAPKPKPNPDRGFDLRDFEVVFYAPEIGVANFNLDFWRKNGDQRKTTIQYRITDVYAKRNGAWIQVASHTAIAQDWIAKQNSLPATLPPPLRQRLMETREAVWRAWFSNDTAKLNQLIPAELLTIEAGAEQWGNRASVLEGAQKFAAAGGKLLRLEFPKTEIQVYGRTIILYTSYLYETEVGGKRENGSGRATEVFVLRDGQFVNTGWHLDSGK